MYLTFRANCKCTKGSPKLQKTKSQFYETLKWKLHETGFSRRRVTKLSIRYNRIILIETVFSPCSQIRRNSNYKLEEKDKATLFIWVDHPSNDSKISWEFETPTNHIIQARRSVIMMRKKENMPNGRHCSTSGSKGENERKENLEKYQDFAEEQLINEVLRIVLKSFIHYWMT